MSKILKMLNKKVRKDNKGFTLVELLVVIAIIGILAAVAVPTIFKNIDKSKAADLESDYNAIKTAVLSFSSDKSGALPTEIGDLDAYLDKPAGNSPFKGAYSITTSDNTCTLKFTSDPVLKDEETVIDKLQEDLGEDVVSVDEDGVVSLILVK